VGKLTAAQVRHAKPGRHGDGRGLYLQVIGGSRTWVLRYEHRKRERWMGLRSAEFVTLAQARDRFGAGVSTTLEVVQAQQQVAGAESDYISSLFSFNLAKLSLARAMGEIESDLANLLKGNHP